MNINLTLIAQLVSFAFFVWFTMKFVWPPLVQAMEERKTKIADGLAAAERGVQEQEKAKLQADQVITEAKQKAADIKANAEKQASIIIEDAKNKGEEEGARQIALAHAEIEQETNRAREELRGKVAELAIVGAEKILRKEINLEAHKEIVDSVSNGI
tara:strand:+ start:2956 stop:3426 length:471 start_codon:yes stop_codon:yes gene_type:complete